MEGERRRTGGGRGKFWVISGGVVNMAWFAARIRVKGIGILRNVLWEIVCN